uniref:SPOR domain-containing protein n=2 Tax=Yoonia sp. TaxID=2212373 RepID=UPI004047A765|tara:strand:- start:1215 stop:2114 length:900 start_codon:yes stop_codon:yes gene_type:complete
MGQQLNLSKHKRLSIVLIATLGLSACAEDGTFSLAANTAGQSTNPAMRQSTQLVERDVEAPDVFQITSQGLWDGRPSLGGVWVAHPTAVDPERVIIRNEANGKFVIGALFRRERENPGPALQVSSDAAEALGLLAGAPVSLNVTALRREEAPVAPVAEATTDFGAPEDIAATPLDPIAGAAAAIEAAEAATPPDAPVATPAPIAAPVTTAPIAQPTKPAASALAKPFIQIGIFNIQANARRTASTLRADGLSTTVLAQESQGRPFWRVIVGPAPTASDRAAVLAKVKALGFADAYFVTN